MNSRRLRRTQLVGFVLLVLLAGAAWYFVLGPRFGQPDAIQEQVAATLDQKSLIDQQTLALQRRQRYLPVAEQEVKSLDTKFPTPEDADAASLGLAMSEAAKKAGVPESALTLSIADPQTVAGDASGGAAQAQPTPAPSESAAAGNGQGGVGATAAIAAPTVKMSQFSITASGSQQQLSDFLTYLHNLPQALAIDSAAVAFAAQPTTAGSPAAHARGGTYTLTISGRAFYLSAIPPVPDNLRLASPAASPSSTPTPKPTARP